MRAGRLVVALFVGAIGFIWIGQGVGLIGGSFMSRSSFWAVIGAVLVCVAAAVVVIERRRAHRR